MVTNDAIFARLNKIAAVQTNLSEEMRKVELALVDDAAAVARELQNFVTQDTVLTQKFERLEAAYTQWRSEAEALYEEYDTFKSETQGKYAEAELLVERLGEAADALGIDPSELGAYDELTRSMTTMEEIADYVSTILDDELFSFLD
jgi:hypothetical protein